MTEAILSSLELDAQKLMAAASQLTGLDDYGDTAFVEGLTVLVDALRTEARLSEMGTMMSCQDILRLLSNRLGYQRDLTRHPEILDDPLVAPIIIIGLPRTGTSKLQRMMSADPAVQRLEVWRLLNPAPVAGAEPGQPDPRIGMGEQFEAFLSTQYPDFQARHPMEAHEPDEELFLLETTFESPISSLWNRLPSHRAFVQSRSSARSYDYVRGLLQYLQWQDGGARGRPWIMKSPVHVGEIPTLLATFPDATVVHCHRDPRVIVPSFASLLEVARGMYSDHVDLLEMGADFTEYWSNQLNRNLAARDEIGEDHIVDVYYQDIRDNSTAVIEQIYAHAGRTITPEARAAFEAYEQRRPEGHFGTHTYALERYGLDDRIIEDAFADYLNRFPRMRKVTA